MAEKEPPSKESGTSEEDKESSEPSTVTPTLTLKDSVTEETKEVTAEVSKDPAPPPTEDDTAAAVTTEPKSPAMTAFEKRLSAVAELAFLAKELEKFAPMSGGIAEEEGEIEEEFDLEYDSSSVSENKEEDIGVLVSALVAAISTESDPTARIRDIVYQSTPELVILVSEYMYRNEITVKGTSKKTTDERKKRRRRRITYHRKKSDPYYYDDDDYNDDDHNSGNNFYLPTDLARLIHKFLFIRGRELDDYEVLKVVGRGTFGKVVVALDKREIRMKGEEQPKMYALKTIKIKSMVKMGQIRHTMDELRFYSMITLESQCPFLVRMHYAFRSTGLLCFVLDFYNGGELFFHLKKNRRFPERSACVIAAEVSAAVMHLHSKFDIVHRNLKPEDIVLQKDGHCVIIDLGLSKQIPDGTTSKTFCGTPEYLAPEVVGSQPHGKPVDWWAIGILLYELCVGIPPFYSQNVNEMYRKIREAPLLFPPSLTTFVKDIITQLLQRDPKKRLGTKSFDEVKNHPFWTEIAPGSFKDSYDFWNKLQGFQVIPPYKPTVSDHNPFTNFDPMFLKEKAVHTPTVRDEKSEKAFNDAVKDPFEFF